MSWDRAAPPARTLPDIRQGRPRCLGRGVGGENRTGPDRRANLPEQGPLCPCPQLWPRAI